MNTELLAYIAEVIVSFYIVAVPAYAMILGWQAMDRTSDIYRRLRKLEEDDTRL